MTPELSIRLFTNDQTVLDKVFYANSYRLKPADNKDAVVVDIGAHAGYFVFTCLAMGFKRVFAFEPFVENYKLLVKNTEQAEAGLVSTHQVGVFPQANNFKFFYPEFGEKKFYDFADIDVDGKEGLKSSTAPVITLDEILQEYVDAPVDILKLNIGYAEDAILFTSHLLAHKVKAICGETSSNEKELETLRNTMTQKGFKDIRFIKAEDRTLFLIAKENCDNHFLTK